MRWAWAIADRYTRPPHDGSPRRIRRYLGLAQQDASGSMPIGNGDFGANVWVEQSTGDLLLLLSKTDAWDENSINLKVGRIRIMMSPNPLASGTPFRVELRLRTADILISCGSTRVIIWVDANHPVLRVEIDSDVPIEARATVEMWRTEPRTIKTQTGDLFRDLSGKDPYPTIVSPDNVLVDEPDRVVWCHHNDKREHDGFDINLRLQGLGSFLEEMKHPLLARTFGAAMETTRHRISIYALTMHPATVEQWQEKLDAMIASIKAIDPTDARREHEGWWDKFWNRSWILIDTPDAFHVMQGYVLQRFMNGCAGRGAQPIKFNGSLFTIGKPDDPDFRRWGGPGFWFMNTRLNLLADVRRRRF
jgi:hypothetical protein